MGRLGVTETCYISDCFITFGKKIPELMKGLGRNQRIQKRC
jgi:hypothetical protein